MAGNREDAMHEEFIKRMRSQKKNSQSSDDPDSQPPFCDKHQEYQQKLRSVPSETSKPNSIDILEDCLMTAYNARKNSITQRMRTSKNKQQRNSSNARRTANRTPIKQSMQNAGFSDDEEGAPSVSVPPPSVTSRQQPTAAATSRPPSQTTRPPPKVASPSPEKKIKPISSTFSSLEDQMHDTEAAEIFEAFKKDLGYWYKNNTLKRNDEDLRGDIADDMTERYLCQRLDPLPASRVVTHIRKTVSQIIENFAADGTLPPEMSGERRVESVEPMTKYAKQKAEEDALKVTQEAEQEAKRKEKIEKTAADRAAAEKRRVKEQYEQYMALKKKASKHEDNEKEHEIESHLDDIRSLIQSIKEGGGEGAP